LLKTVPSRFIYITIDRKCWKCRTSNGFQ